MRCRITFFADSSSSSIWGKSAPVGSWRMPFSVWAFLILNSLEREQSLAVARLAVSINRVTHMVELAKCLFTIHQPRITGHCPRPHALLSFSAHYRTQATQPLPKLSH